MFLKTKFRQKNKEPDLCNFKSFSNEALASFIFYKSKDLSKWSKVVRTRLQSAHLIFLHPVGSSVRFDFINQIRKFWLGFTMVVCEKI